MTPYAIDGTGIIDMQCHKCELNGKPTERCLSCNCADYLDNDFKTVNPVDNIEKVSGKILEDYYIQSKRSDFPIKVDKNKTKQNYEDCENVLSVLKKCHHSSFKHILCMVMLFASLGTNAGMLTNILDGKSLTECAKIMNVSKQAASQQWSRLVANNRELEDVYVSKRGRKKKNI